ncbi:MAG: C39 family peptidase [Candidatus Taylorbacteria bacterium]|nr:C39 family peptidase [Candidatus Taylorbacteria bacterium]
MKKIVIISVFVTTVFVGGFIFVYKKLDKGVIKEPIPSAQVYKSPNVNSSPSLAPIHDTLYTIPDTINLAVPFTVQAPNANWDEVHQEFCEEASVLMAASYIKGWDIPNADIADRKMFEIKTFEEQRFGYYKDTTAEETATILREFYGIDKVKVIYEPTTLDIKKALADGKAVLAPAAGRQLGNPYFRQPGPLYHMLVIKGYTKESNFITNDPGTRRGADYIYSPNILMNAIHDWNGGDVEHGRKVIIIVG